jgi:hypothetical protein
MQFWMQLRVAVPQAFAGACVVPHAAAPMPCAMTASCCSPEPPLTTLFCVWP